MADANAERRVITFPTWRTKAYKEEIEREAFLRPFLAEAPWGDCDWSGLLEMIQFDETDPNARYWALGY